MGISLLYFGSSGGGSKFAYGVQDAIGLSTTKLLMSSANPDIDKVKAIQIDGIPKGIWQNVLFLVKRKKRKRIIDFICALIQQDTVVFLMPHPIDFAIRRNLKNPRVFTVIHDPKRHKGDVWPNFLTIRRLMLSGGYKIYLSQYTMSELKVLPDSQNALLPLLMGPIPVQEQSHFKNFDFAFIGRHKKYKNYAFQVKLINRLSTNYQVFSSIPPKKLRKIVRRKTLTINTKWLETKTFDKVLSQSRCVVLTHESASQSGILIEAALHGVNVAVPDIPSLVLQTGEYQMDWIYKSKNLESALEVLTDAISVSNSLSITLAIYKKNSEKWREFFDEMNQENRN